jgi:hypothetical protein
VAFAPTRWPSAGAGTCRPVFDLDPSAANILPSRYRQVALSRDVADLAPEALIAGFTGREAYLRTRFIVARRQGATALVEVGRESSDALFSRTTGARVLASADECRYVVDTAVDVGVPSQLAAVAVDYPDERCVVVEGRYSHVSFILNPAPFRLRVLDVVPPLPSKLFDQVRRVLDLAEDLPPVVAELSAVDSRDVLAHESTRTLDQVLVPCRGSGVGLATSTVSYLDERPARNAWTLLGCERSQQIHRWFYGDTAPMVDVCPRRFITGSLEAEPVLTRCCLLQEGPRSRPSGMLVPWGSSLGEVRRAIELVLERAGVAWTPT